MRCLINQKFKNAFTPELKIIGGRMIRRAVILIYLTTVALFPVVSRAEMKWSLDEPVKGFASNSVGDIVYTVTPQGDTIIWVGTGNGLSKSTHGSVSWVTYNRQTGLNENDISALAVADTSLWVACAYTRLEDGQVVPYGKGFNHTSNLGESWDSFIPWQVDFAGMVAYDIAIDDTTFWAACWYGGLIHCLLDHDSLKCENVFVDSFARNDFEGQNFQYLNNRFFSVVVDTNCPIQKRLKNSITDIFYDGRLIWVATQNGLHVSADYGRTYFPYDTTSGLNSNGVYCVGGDSTIILAGLYQEGETTPLPLIPDLTGADFSLTTNYGYTWSTSHPSLGQANASGRFPMDIVKMDSVIWAACGRGGLIRSFDRGQNWENVFVDTVAQRRYQDGQLKEEDVFTAVAVDTSGDTTFVWAGTRDGVYKMIFTVSDTPDTVYRFLYYSAGGGMGNDPTDPSMGIVSIGIQTAYDQRSIWLAGYSFYTYNPTPDDIYPVTLKSTDGGTTWNSYLGGIPARDMAIWDTTVWIATEEGLMRSKDGGEHWDTFEVIDSTTGDLLIPSYFTSVCTGLDIGGLTVLVGSSDGLAISRDEGVTWEVTKFAPTYRKAIWAGSAAGIYKFLYDQSSQFDTVLGYSQDSLGLTGDFVVSLAVQQYQGRKIIWAGTQPTYSGAYGVSYTTDDGDTWNTTLLGDKAWNFAFDDSVIWVATSAGVKRSDDWGASWKIFNSINGIYTTEFSSVAIIGNEVWAGSADGLAWSSDDGVTWDTVRTAVPIGTKGSETAYAYPSPFSPVVAEGQVTRIRYRPIRDGQVTIKVYDFAMNLVKTLEDRQQQSGGSEYEAVWDGRNGKGEVVANGVYFFKVEAPGGQTEWGKVVVLK
jgi:hypothetical protein